MDKSISEDFFFLDGDESLVDGQGLFIEEDYNGSDFPSVKLWNSPNDIGIESGMVRYNASKAEEKFKGIDYFPGDAALPVVTDRLKELIENNCSAAEVGFHPCDVRFKNGKVRRLWNLCPFQQRRCVDEGRTNAAWWTQDLPPFEKTLRYAEGVILKNEFFSGNLFRLSERESSILISNKLKNIFVSSNVKGAVYIKPSEVVIGIKPSTWG